MTFQVLSQSESPSSILDEGQVRNDDESEIEKTNGAFYAGDGEILVDMSDDFRQLGLVNE